MPYDLSGRVHIVTGGAGDIGFAAAERLDADGALVALFDVDEAAGRERLMSLNRCESRFYCVDVSDSAAVDAAFAEVLRDFGRLDGLVNAAGIAPGADCRDTSDELWRRVIDINLSGVHFCSRAAARIFAAQRRGAIVNVSSTNGLVGEELLTAYNASKFGVMGITKTMALELGPYGVRVNAVNPGFIETRLTAEPRQDPEFVRAYHAKIPLRRFGKPEEVGRCIAFLLSDDASFVTGAGLVIDGGQICH